jgi:hypothetical protein
VSRGRIAWHPAFYKAVELELYEFRDALKLEAEHVLNAEPLKVDLLIVKKLRDVHIDKNIAAIFRDVNLVEYKCPTDSVSIADFHKVLAYAHLYISLHNLRAANVTITLAQRAYPRALVRYLVSRCGYDITKQSDGIHTVTGYLLPIQIIETKWLPDDENLWLRNLSTHVNAVDMEKILTEQEKYKGRMNLDAYIDVITNANAKAAEEVLGMMRVGPKLRKVLVETGAYAEAEKYFEQRGEARGEARGKLEGKLEVAKKLFADEFSIERISRITDIPMDELKEHLGA